MPVPTIAFADDAWDSFETMVYRLAGFTVEIAGARYVLDGTVTDDGNVNGRAEDGNGSVSGPLRRIVVGGGITVL